MTASAPPRFLIAGYYGFGNAGDEAVLEAILQGLDRHFPGHETCVLSADPQATAGAYPVRSVQRWSMREVWSEMGRTDALIQGGGGLIQDSTSRMSPVYYLGILAMARLRRVPSMIFAQGVGPIRCPLARRWTALEFRRAGLVTVRDPDSLALLETLGVRGASLVADPALLLQPSRGPLQESLTKLVLDPSAPRALITVRQWPGGECALESCAAAGNWLRERGCEVLVAAFQEPDDLQAAGQVAGAIPGAHVLHGPRRAAEWVTQVMQARMVVSMRLHGLIFAAAHGVPAVGISYDPKVRAFAELAGQPWLDLPDCTPESLTRAVSQTWDESDSVREKRLETGHRLTSQAAKSFDLLEALLSRGEG